MAIIDSLNEIIAKNGGEVSGRGGSIETKLKTLSELSISGGGGGTVYECTLEDGKSGKELHFYANPLNIKPGDVISFSFEEGTSSFAIICGKFYSHDSAGIATNVFAHGAPEPIAFHSTTSIPTDDDGKPIPSDYNIEFYGNLPDEG